MEVGGAGAGAGDSNEVSTRVFENEKDSIWAVQGKMSRGPGGGGGLGLIKMNGAGFGKSNKKGS